MTAAERRAPSSRARIVFLGTIYVNAFVLGAVIMGYEMLGSRYLSPWFGGDIYTWGALISTVLMSLMLGAYGGGHLADRRPSTALLGALVAAGASLRDPWLAAALMMGVGALGGVLMVPMNALLQHRGMTLLSPGRSIAVQGFNENASVLVMLALYAWTVWIDVPIAPLMSGFGVAVALAMAWMGWRFRRLLRQRMQREPESASRPAESRKGVV